MPLSCRTSAILLPPGHQQPGEFNLNFDHLPENSLAWVHHRSPASSLACCIPHIWAVDYIPLHHYHPTQYPPTIFNKQSTPSDLIILLLPHRLGLLHTLPFYIYIYLNLDKSKSFLGAYIYLKIDLWDFWQWFQENIHLSENCYTFKSGCTSISTIRK